MKGRWIVFWGVCLLLAMAERGLADGVIRDSVGAREAGRGGTNIAFADNGEVVLDNPAGMVNVDGCGLWELGFDFLFTNLSYADADNHPTDAWDNPFPMPQLSIVRKSADGRWALGLGAFAPAGMADDYTMTGPAPFGGVQHYKSLGGLGKILPGIAYSVTDRLSIGGTFGLALSHVELVGPYFLQGQTPFRGTPTKLALYTTGVAPTWSVGLQYQLSEATTFGVSYQSETRVHMRGNSHVNDVPLLGSSDFDTRFQIVWPQTVGFGFKHELCPHRIVALDLIWTNWSRAFDNFDLEFLDPSNPVFAMVLGPSVPEQFPLGWRDTLSMRLGYEQQLDEAHVLRLGYINHRSAIPTRTLSPFIPAILEHAFSVGLGLNRSPWELDLAYQYSFAPSRTVTDSDWAGGDFDSSHHNVQAHWLFLSLLRRY